MSKVIDSRKYGIGSISLILSVLGTMLWFSGSGERNLGEHILNEFGMSFPIGLVSLVILFISFFIGYKYKDDKLSKSGRIIATIVILLMFSLIIINAII